MRTKRLKIYRTYLTKESKKIKYSMKFYKPFDANYKLIGEYYDEESCFIDSNKTLRTLENNNWKYTTFHRKKEKYGRCWIKITKNTIIATNFYPYDRKNNMLKCLKNLFRYVKKDEPKIKTIKKTTLENFYTNNGEYYIIKREN